VFFGGTTMEEEKYLKNAGNYLQLSKEQATII